MKNSRLPSAKPSISVIWLVLLVVAVRLVWAALVPFNPVSDAAMYHAFAEELAAGNGYILPNGQPTVFWPVGPSAFYALFYQALGVSGWTVVTANTLLSITIVIGLFRLGAIHFGSKVAVIAATIFAIWPVWIEFTTVPNSELPFIALLIWAVVIINSSIRHPYLAIAFSSVLMVGAAYMRPTVLPLILLLPLLSCPFHSLRRTVVRLAVALLVAIVLLAPWAARNQALFGEPVLVSANFGVNLWMGNNPDAGGGYMSVPTRSENNEVVRDAELKAESMKFILENPVSYMLLCIKRIGLSFDRETIGVAWNEPSIPPSSVMPLKAVSSLYWLLVFTASLGGVVLWIVRQPSRFFDPLVIAPGLFAAVAILVVGSDRYHMSMMPFIALFAAYLVDEILLRRRPPSAPMAQI